MFSSVQSLNCVRLFVTPWIIARQASLFITNSRSSLRLTSIESVMPSSHLILCCPLLLLSPIPPSIRVFSNESTVCMRWPKYWSFSFSIIPSKEIPGLISFRMDWLDLLAVQGTLQSLLQYHSSGVLISPIFTKLNIHSTLILSCTVSSAPFTARLLKELAIPTSQMPSAFPSIPLIFDFHPSRYPDTAGQSHWWSSCCNCQGHPAVLITPGLLKAWPCWSLQFWEAFSRSSYKPPPIPVFLLPPGCCFYVSYGLSSPSSYLTHHQMLSVSQTWGLLTLFTLHTDTWTSHPLPLFVRIDNIYVCGVQTCLSLWNIFLVPCLCLICKVRVIIIQD